MKIIKISAIWCPSCIIMNKIWINLKQKYIDITFIEYDLDFDCDECNKYNVGDILPVLIFMDNDKEIGRLIGEKKEKDIINEIERLM